MAGEATDQHEHPARSSTKCLTWLRTIPSIFSGGFGTNATYYSDNTGIAVKIDPR